MFFDFAMDGGTTIQLHLIFFFTFRRLLTHHMKLKALAAIAMCKTTQKFLKVTSRIPVQHKVTTEDI